MSQVFIVAMLFCFVMGCSLKSREVRKASEEAEIKRRHASTAFAEANDEVKPQE